MTVSVFSRFTFLLMLVLFAFGCSSVPSKAERSTPTASPEPVAEANVSASSTPKVPQELALTTISLTLAYTKQGVEVTLPWPNARVWRGYRPVNFLPLENFVELDVVNGKAIDSQVPHGVELFYLALQGEEKIARGQIRTLPRLLPKLVNPYFHVDKYHYIVSVIDDHKVIKSYPMAIGSKPENRKLCQDNASTPEGIYKVYMTQPDATYYKALDIDYPTNIDKIRHRLAIEKGLISEGRPIGGEIQIHGQGIARNWTHGCVALKNSDMDEIFRNLLLGKHATVFITGSEIFPDDLFWLLYPNRDYVKKLQERLIREKFYRGEADGKFGNGTAFALGRFQSRHALPMTCQLDSRTRAFLDR